MAIYEHRQQGGSTRWAIRVSLLVEGAAAFLVWKIGGPRPVLGVLIVVFFILLITAVLFDSLTVRIDPGVLRIWFGPGYPCKSVAVNLMVACRSVRNPWYFGWGIHYIGRGWLYNISGSDAVELDLKDGSRLRIGTDEPDVLESALCKEIALNKSST